MPTPSSPTWDQTFTDLADVVSEGMGYWWVTTISVLIVLVWLALGPSFHWSDTWQLMINTPTTIIELWIGFLLAAAANRSERRHREILLHIQHLIEQSQREIDMIREDIENG